MRIIAVIPARMGSTRLPRKNALEIQADKNLVQHAIDCALDSGLVEKAYVTSDDPHLPYVRATHIHRPPLLSGAKSDIVDAVAHATEEAEKQGKIDYVVTLQPAVLARSPLIVRRILEAVLSSDAQGAVTAARTVPWQWKVKNGRARNDWSPGAYPRSQDSAEHLAEINAVQVASYNVVMDRQRWGLPLLLAELPHWAAALDIDDPQDLQRARDLWPWARLRLETWEPRMHRVEIINERASA
jgi:CMP-N-acetylneuraminic acid synthetase